MLTNDDDSLPKVKDWTVDTWLGHLTFTLGKGELGEFKEAFVVTVHPEKATHVFVREAAEDNQIDCSVLSVKKIITKNFSMNCYSMDMPRDATRANFVGNLGKDILYLRPMPSGIAEARLN